MNVVEGLLITGGSLKRLFAGSGEVGLSLDEIDTSAGVAFPESMGSGRLKYANPAICQSTGPTIEDGPATARGTRRVQQ